MCGCRTHTHTHTLLEKCKRQEEKEEEVQVDTGSKRQVGRSIITGWAKFGHSMGLHKFTIE